MYILFNSIHFYQLLQNKKVGSLSVGDLGMKNKRYLSQWKWAVWIFLRLFSQKVLLNFCDSSLPPLSSVSVCVVSVPHVQRCSWKPRILLLMPGHVRRSRTLRHNTYVTHLAARHHVGISSSHMFTRGERRRQYLEGDRDHIPVTSTTIYGYHCSVLLDSVNV